MVTIALKRVENPLEFGVVVVNDEGRIERFLEKPTWGQVFSDTVNTGIYVLEPEVFDHIPADSQVRLQPGAVPQAVRDGGAALRLRRRGLLAGHRQPPAVPRRQPRPARRQGPGRDARASSCRTASSSATTSISTRSRTSQGPAFIGNYVKIDPTASIGAYSVLGNNVVVKEHAETRHSVVDANTYVGASSKVLGRHRRASNCDIKAGVTFSEGVAVGDECMIGEQAYIAPTSRSTRSRRSSRAPRSTAASSGSRAAARSSSARTASSASSTSTSPPSSRSRWRWRTARC